MTEPSRLLPWFVLAAACAAALVAVSCGKSAPSTSTPPASPTPPASGAGAGTASQSCRLGPGTQGAACARTSTQLAEQVMAAMDLLVRQKPQLFDKNDEAAPLGAGNYKVLDGAAFIDGVIANLQAAGLCAQRDPDDYSYEQIQVKSENGFSEDFDVLLSSGHVWHNQSSYRRTCIPASFPVERSADLPPIGSGCGRPYPPPIHHFWVHELAKRETFTVVDSTPVVGPDLAYCTALGYTDGRQFCAVRPDGHPERLACENWRVGVAEDNGRPGPTWRHASGSRSFCTGEASGCENHPDNQYQLVVYKSGRYLVCAAKTDGACGEITVER